MLLCAVFMRARVDATCTHGRCAYARRYADVAHPAFPLHVTCMWLARTLSGVTTSHYAPFHTRPRTYRQLTLHAQIYGCDPTEVGSSLCNYAYASGYDYTYNFEVTIDTDNKEPIEQCEGKFLLSSCTRCVSLLSVCVCASHSTRTCGIHACALSNL